MKNIYWVGLSVVSIIIILVIIGYNITGDTYYCQSRGIVMECTRFSSSGLRCYPNLIDTKGYSDCPEGWIKLSDFVFEELIPDETTPINKTPEYNESHVWIYEPDNSTWTVVPIDSYEYRRSKGEDIAPEPDIIDTSLSQFTYDFSSLEGDTLVKLKTLTTIKAKLIEEHNKDIASLKTEAEKKGKQINYWNPRIRAVSQEITRLSSLLPYRYNEEGDRLPNYDRISVRENLTILDLDKIDTTIYFTGKTAVAGYPDPLENFSTYDVVDTGSDFTINDTAFWAQDVYQNYDAYISDDKGVDHFGYTFEHTVQLKGGDTYSASKSAVCAYANVVDDYKYWQDQNSQAIGMWWGSAEDFTLTDWETGNSDTFAASQLTWYYATIQRTNSTWIETRFYSDAARTTLLDTIGIILVGERKYRYIVPYTNYNEGVANRILDMFVYDYDLQEAVADTTPPTVSLIAPANNTLYTASNSIDFNYSAVDDTAVTNCSLYINNTLNQSNAGDTNFTSVDIGNGDYEWFINCSDAVPNWGYSGTYNLTVDYTAIDTQAPAYNLTNNASTTSRLNSDVNWSINISDDTGLSYYFFAHNQSGTMANVSEGLLSGTWATISDNITVSLTRGSNICGQYWLNDTSNNVNQTEPSCFTVANTPPNTPSIIYPIEHGNYTNVTSINVSSSDIDGDALTYYIYVNGQLNITTGANATAWNLSDGNYNITISAYDGTDFSENSSYVYFSQDWHYITACRTITESGYYVVPNSFIPTGSTCISIQANNVVIDGNGKKIENVSLTNKVFYIQNSVGNITIKNFANVSVSNPANSYIIDSDASAIKNITISNNTFEYSYTPFRLRGGNNISITGNRILRAGVYLGYATGTFDRLHITNNTFIGTGATSGFSFSSTTVTNGLAYGNLFTNRSTGSSGAFMNCPENNDGFIFQENTFFNNTVFGKDIYINGCDNSIIFNNKFIGDKTQYTIEVFGESSNLLIYGNNMSCDDKAGSHGVILRNARDSIIRDNQVTDCGFGFLAHNGSINNTFYSNKVDSSSVGIYFIDDSRNNVMTNFTITNTATGVSFFRYGYGNLPPSGNLFANSTITSYSGRGIYGTNTTTSEGYGVINKIREVIVSSGVNAVELISKTDGIELINVTYAGQSESVKTGSYFKRKWYYRAYVNDTSGTARSGVNISIYNVSGILVHNMTTKATGYSDVFEITEYSNNGNKTYQNNYLINATLNITISDSHNYNVTTNLNNLADLFTLNVSGAAIDTSTPSWSNNKTNINSSLAYASQNYQFNITWTDNTALDSVLIEHNFTGTLANESFTGNTSSEYYYNIELGAGVYVWKSYANDTSGNSNASDQWMFVVNKASTTVNMTLNKTESDKTLTYLENLNATFWTSTGTATMYRNGTDVSSENNTDVILGAGYYNYTVENLGDENYTASSKSFFATVNKASSEINLSLNGTDSNMSVNITSTVRINATMKTPSTGAILIYQNGTEINSGATSIQNLSTYSTAGYYNITAVYPSTQNYTYSDDTLFITSIDNLPPVITLLNASSTTNISTVISWSCSENCNYSIYVYNSTQQKDGNLTGSIFNNTFALSHSQYIENLSNSTSYFINLTVCDILGNCANNDSLTFNTSANVAPGDKCFRFQNYAGSDWMSICNNDLNVTDDIIAGGTICDSVGCIGVYNDTSQWNLTIEPALIPKIASRKIVTGQGTNWETTLSDPVTETAINVNAGVYDVQIGDFGNGWSFYSTDGTNTVRMNDGTNSIVTNSDILVDANNKYLKLGDTQALTLRHSGSHGYIATSVGDIWMTAAGGDVQTSANIRIASDSRALYLGTGSNATIGYLNRQMYINPKAIGNAQLQILGRVNMTENITMKSPSGANWNCGVDDSGTFSCS